MSKYIDMLNRTMNTIAGDLNEALEDTLDSEGLAEASLDYVSIHGGDEDLAVEFSNLSYEEQMEHALPVARKLI